MPLFKKGGTSGGATYINIQKKHLKQYMELQHFIDEKGVLMSEKEEDQSEPSALHYSPISPNSPISPISPPIFNKKVEQREMREMREIESTREIETQKESISKEKAEKILEDFE